MRVETQTIGLEEIRAKLQRFPANYREEIVRRVNAAAVALQRRIITDLIGGVWGIKSRRGVAGLAGSVAVQPASAGEEITTATVSGGAGQPHGIYFEIGGKGPYEIVAKPGSVLAWPAFGPWQKSAITQRRFAFTKESIFARRVIHPAIKKAPWFSGPVKEMRATLEEMIQPTEAASLFEGG